VVEPVQMLDGAAPIDDALALSSGDYHTCVVRSDRRVWCTGRNAQGQLGRGPTEEFECSRGMPRPVETGEGEYLEGASQVAGGFRSSCAIVGDQVFCWGDPRCGQLGDGTGVLACDAPTTDPCDDEGSSPPVAVALGNIAPCAPVQIGAGQDFACALCMDGRVACWGDGERGKLGNDDVTGSTAPVEVFGIDDAIEIAIGYKSSCALLANDDVVCWGDGSEGQLGNGSIGAGVFSAQPVPVIGLPP
jgi:alpha-tubulin suppressor-like RCC1 family protein